jgi:phage terminase small subunit
MAKLTERQQRFVKHYISTGNARLSAENAGYSQPQIMGSRLLKSKVVAAALVKHAAAQSEQQGITRQAKKKRLSEIIEGDDDRLSMQAIDIDNKMEAEYVQKHEIDMGINKLTEQELEAEFIEDLRSRGYTVIEPNE